MLALKDAAFKGKPGETCSFRLQGKHKCGGAGHFIAHHRQQYQNEHPGRPLPPPGTHRVERNTKRNSFTPRKGKGGGKGKGDRRGAPRNQTRPRAKAKNRFGGRPRQRPRGGGGHFGAAEGDDSDAQYDDDEDYYDEEPEEEAGDDDTGWYDDSGQWNWYEEEEEMEVDEFIDIEAGKFYDDDELVEPAAPAGQAMLLVSPTGEPVVPRPSVKPENSNQHGNISSASTTLRADGLGVDDYGLPRTCEVRPCWPVRDFPADGMCQMTNPSFEYRPSGMLTAFGREAGEERLRDFQRLARERGYSPGIALYEPGGTTRLSPMVSVDTPHLHREEAGCRSGVFNNDLTPKERSQVLARCSSDSTKPISERYACFRESYVALPNADEFCDDCRSNCGGDDHDFDDGGSESSD